MVAATLAPAQGDDTSRAFQHVIDGQIAAFARDDGAAAFEYATPDIQRMFGTPDRFMEMARAGFQPVYRPLPDGTAGGR